MSEHITLLGAEQVQNAGFAIQNAANQIGTAAYALESTAQAQRQFLDDWLARFTEQVDRLVAITEG